LHAAYSMATSPCAASSRSWASMFMPPTTAAPHLPK
jgi:hypothetical protein